MRYEIDDYVDKSNFSINPMNAECTLSLIFWSQFKNYLEIEIVFDKLVKLHLEFSNENYDCAILSSNIQKEYYKFSGQTARIT